jgi:hypothetical protein
MRPVPFDPIAEFLASRLPYGANLSWSETSSIGLDPQNGNDKNSGLLAAPLRTWAEVLRRYGGYQPLLPYGQSVAVTLLSSQLTADDPIVFEPFMPGGGNLSLIGTLIPLGASFSAGTVTAKVRAAGAVPLTIAGFPAGLSTTTPILVENQTRGSRAMLDTISGTTATVCQPFTTTCLTTVQYPIQHGAIVLAEDDTWTVGDTLQLYTLPQAYVKLWQSRGSDANPNKAVTWMGNIHVPDVSGTPGISIVAIGGEQNNIMSCCAFDPVVVSNTYKSGIGIDAVTASMFLNCSFIGGVQACFKSFVGGTVNPLGVATLVNFNEGLVIDGDIIFHGSVNFKSSRYSNIGWALIAPGGTLRIIYGSTVLIRTGAEWFAPQACLYGASVALLGPNSSLNNYAGRWVDALKVTTISMEGLATGSYRSGSTWTDGVALTATNLDTFGGLQNTLSGSRFNNI